MLRKGYYPTKGGYHARLDSDITVCGLGVIRGIGFVAYNVTGEFTYKDEAYEPHSGDSLDLIVDQWQAQPFTSEVVKVEEV